MKLSVNSSFTGTLYDESEEHLLRRKVRNIFE